MKQLTTLILYGVISAVSLPQSVVSQEPAPAAEQAAKAKELFEEGRVLLFKGDFPGAAGKLEQAVKTDPGKLSYNLLLAKAHRYAGDDKRAVAVLEKVLALQPDHVQAGIELAEMLSPSKQPDRVIAVLQPLLRFQRDYPLYHLLAEAYQQKGQLDQARRNYEEAIKANDRNAVDHFQLGGIYLGEKRFAQAAAAYEMAGTLGTSSVDYHSKMASIYFNLGNYLGKVEIVLDPEGTVGKISDDWLLIAAVPGQEQQYYMARPRSAIYQAARAKKMGGADFPLLFLEANIWLHSGNFARADALYRDLDAGKKVAKEDAGAFWFQWSQAAFGLQDPDNYLTRLNNAIAAEPAVYGSALSNAYLRVANLYHQRGDLDRFTAFLEKAVAVNPLSSRLHLSLGDAFWINNGRPKAIEQYKLVLELEPEFAQRVLLLNRIRGQDDTDVAIGPALAPGIPGVVQKSLDLSRLRCPVTNGAVMEVFSADRAGAIVYFASRQAVEEFKKNPNPYAIKVNHQLYLTGQARALSCPLTSERLNPTIKVTVAGAEVPLCCKGCQTRIERANVDEQLGLLFDAEAFSNYKIMPRSP